MFPNVFDVGKFKGNFLVNQRDYKIDEGLSKFDLDFMPMN